MRSDRVVVFIDGFMSPEQAGGAAVDRRTDIWSLGAVLYEMTVGRAPFTGNTPREMVAAIVTTEPPPLSSHRSGAPSELQQIVCRALRKDPGERYQNAKEMLDALKGLRHELEFAAELRSSAAAPFWLRWVRSPAAWGLTLLAAALAWSRRPRSRRIVSGQCFCATTTSLRWKW